MWCIALFSLGIVNGQVMYSEPGQGWYTGFMVIGAVLLFLSDVSLLEKNLQIILPFQYIIIIGIIGKKVRLEKVGRGFFPTDVAYKFVYDLLTSYLGKTICNIISDYLHPFNIFCSWPTCYSVSFWIEFLELLSNICLLGFEWHSFYGVYVSGNWK